jgi:hypothetical protein
LKQKEFIKQKSDLVKKYLGQIDFIDFEDGGPSITFQLSLFASILSFTTFVSNPSYPEAC